MRLIFKIAKAELRNLFYSPIAWFLTIAFFVECAISYTTLIGNYASAQEVGGIGLQYLRLLTYNTFSSPYGMFSGVMQNLYLYIPLLTMGLISREINGGTISLLYSSPVKVREIVLGKYLSMMVYSFLLVVVIGIFLVAGVYDINSADYGILLSAALGFYLILCAYSSIGLFMSCLTSYQIVAAISTFIMIGILSYIGTLWQSVDFIRDLTYFLSLSGRSSSMLSGLITTKDVIYFIVIVYIFLGLAICKLQSDRETKKWYASTVKYTVVILSALFIGYITSLPSLIGYWDTTANKDNTLTPNAQQIIKAMGDEKLEITSYANFLDNFYYYGLPEQRNQYLKKWEPYLRFKPDIEFRYVTYYDMPSLGYDLFGSYKGKTMKQIVQQKANASGIDVNIFETPEEIKKEIDLRPEMNRFVMKLTYRGKSTILRVFNDQQIWPSETEVSAAFKRLLQANMPLIDFVNGDGERETSKKGDRDYRTMSTDKTSRYALINQGFNVDTLRLNTQNIPENVAALVIADPQSQLSAAAIKKLTAYIARGGNLLIAGEPGRQHMLNPLLKTLGVQLTNGMLEQQSRDYSPTLVLPCLTKTALGFANTLNRASVDTLPISMNSVSALSYRDTSGFHCQPLLVTKTGVVSNTMKRNPDLDIAVNADGTSGTSAMAQSIVLPLHAKSDRVKISVAKKPVHLIALTNNSATFTTALALTRRIKGKEQRIIISGDADFLSNSELARYAPSTANFYFSTALFKWLDYGQFPIDTSRPDPRDNRVTVSTAYVVFLKMLYIYILPGLIFIFGAVFLIRRRRK